MKVEEFKEMNVNELRENLRKQIEEVNAKVNTEFPTLSISAVLALLQEEFDSKGVAEKTHAKHFNNPESQYYQMSVEQIMEAWQAKGAESCRYGSLLDDYIGLNLTGTENDMELWKLDNNYDWDERLHGLCDSFDNFYITVKESGDTQFIDREQTIYYKVPDMDYYIKGRFDALFYNTKTNKWIVIDWKSSGEISKKPTPWTKKLFGPAGMHYALNWNTYTMQTHFYKKALIEQGYLPEGTSLDDITVLIVQLPGHIVEETGKNFSVNKEAFPFDSEFMDRVYNFAIRKNTLLNNKN